MEDKHYESGLEYARDLTKELISAADREMDLELLQYWCEEITQLCLKRYRDYEKGIKDYYKLTESEVFTCLVEASHKQTADVLASLVEKGKVKMSVNDKGEILYSAVDNKDN